MLETAAVGILATADEVGGIRLAFVLEARRLRAILSNIKDIM